MTDQQDREVAAALSRDVHLHGGEPCYAVMVAKMTDAQKAELAAALARDEDLHGGDPALALEVAAMTEAQRNQSRQNARALGAKLRDTLREATPDELAELRR